MKKNRILVKQPASFKGYNVTNHSDKSIELLAFSRALRNKEKKLTQDVLSHYSRVDRSLYKRAREWRKSA